MTTPVILRSENESFSRKFVIRRSDSDEGSNLFHVEQF